MVSEDYYFTISSLTIIADLSSGWNFITLPFNQTANKTDFIVNCDGINYAWEDAIDTLNGPIVNEYLFGWDRYTQSYLFSDDLLPGYGYWIYAMDSCIILIPAGNTDINGIKAMFDNYNGQ